jgi:hypothetical protein
MNSDAPKTSNAPLVLSALALPTFLFPLGLLGAWLGHRQVGHARRANQRPRWQSRAAVVLGLLSVVDTVALAAWMRHSQTQKLGQVGSALARVATAREQVALTQDTACALAEAFLVQRATEAGAVSCAGPIEATASTATLHGATFAGPPAATYTVCLARRSRWFVTTAIQSGACPESLPTVAEGASVEETERAIQKAMSGVASRTELDAALAPLARVRPAVASATDDGQCPDIGQAGEAGLAVVDAAALPGEANAPPPDTAWKFLNSRAAWTALDTAESARARHNSAMDVFGPDLHYLIVIDAKERRAPQATDHGFTAGMLSGRLALVDVAKGSVLCSAPFEFRSSQSVKTGGGINVGFRLGPKVNLGGKDLSNALDKDFRQNYSRAMTSALDKMTSGRVRPLR